MLTPTSPCERLGPEGARRKGAACTQQISTCTKFYLWIQSFYFTCFFLPGDLLGMLTLLKIKRTYNKEQKIMFQQGDSYLHNIIVICEPLWNHDHIHTQIKLIYNRQRKIWRYHLTVKRMKSWSNISAASTTSAKLEPPTCILYSIKQYSSSIKYCIAHNT